jgi:hypothetical protein
MAFKKHNPGCPCCSTTCGIVYASSAEFDPFEDPSIEDDINPALWIEKQGTAEADASELRIMAANTIVESTREVDRRSCRFFLAGQAPTLGDRVDLYLGIVGEYEEYYRVCIEIAEDAPAIAIWQKAEGEAEEKLRRRQNFDDTFPSLPYSFQMAASLCRGILLCKFSSSDVHFDYSGTHPDYDNEPTATYRPLMISIGHDTSTGIGALSSGRWAVGGTPGGSYFTLTHVQAVNTDHASTDPTCFPEVSCPSGPVSLPQAEGLLSELPSEIVYSVAGSATIRSAWINCDPEDPDYTTVVYAVSPPSEAYIIFEECACELKDGTYTVYFAPDVVTPGTDYCHYYNPGPVIAELCTQYGVCDAREETPIPSPHLHMLLFPALGEGRWIIAELPSGGGASFALTWGPLPKHWKPHDILGELSDTAKAFELGLLFEPGDQDLCDSSDMTGTIDVFIYEASD